MDEVAEQQEIANEISEAISNPVGFGNEVDEVCSCHLEDFPSHLGLTFLHLHVQSSLDLNFQKLTKGFPSSAKFPLIYRFCCGNGENSKRTGSTVH